jgi:hypothetical protein
MLQKGAEIKLCIIPQKSLTRPNVSFPQLTQIMHKLNQRSSTLSLNLLEINIMYRSIGVFSSFSENKKTIENI